jgi:hypothetical protein
MDLRYDGKGQSSLIYSIIAPRPRLIVALIYMDVSNLHCLTTFVVLW